MMHLETKPIGELLRDVLADYAAAYAGCGGTEQSSMSDRWESPAKRRVVSANGWKRADALDRSLYCKI